MAGILSPLQPGRAPQMKTVNVKVDIRRHAIPPMLKHLAAFALMMVGIAAGYFMTAYTPGSAEDVAATIAFFAWTFAAVEAIMDHIISKTPDSRQEVIEEITRAQKTHLTIK